MGDILSLNLCLVCGEPVIYLNKPVTKKCSVCGSEYVCEGACANNHTVCKNCYNDYALKVISDVCGDSKSKNPYEIAVKIMNDPSVRMHDVRHHILIGASLLAAYRNAGGDIDLQTAVAEIVKRGKQIPPGACGYAGACGAAVSAGAFFSIISGATPHSIESWGLANILTGTCLIEIGKLNGPRCCKRDSFVSMQTAACFVYEKTGIQMEMPDKIVCEFSRRNGECLKERCPYYSESE